MSWKKIKCSLHCPLYHTKTQTKAIQVKYASKNSFIYMQILNNVANNNFNLLGTELRYFLDLLH